MNKRIRFFAVGAGLLVASASAHATWYTSEASFLSAINGTFYLEDFNSFTNFGVPLDGTQTTWSAPGANGYGWDAGATGGLWSNISALSTNSANDPLTFTFTGSPVTAFGMNLANTDISGAFIDGVSTITLSNSESNFVSGTGNAFIGWVGNTAITGASVVSSSQVTNNWVQADHVYTGAAAVPEPATMAVLGLGALAMLRRRNKKA